MANPVASIDLDALIHNFKRAQSAAPGCQVFAVIKANAYGHGMLEVADALGEEADGFAVARVEEAVRLRQQAPDQKILVLGGITHPVEVDLAITHQLDLVLHEQKQFEMLESAADRIKMALDVWLKIDTGMHRLGFPASDTSALVEKVSQAGHLSLAGIMTHFANADDLESDYTRNQLEAFEPFESLVDTISLANSAAILGWPKSRKGWIRPGIMLYGSSPFIHGDAEDDGLLPVMTLRSRLISVHQLKKGDAIGYGSTWSCPEEMKVGVVAIGYGDGYPRHAPSGTPVLINGHRAPLVGRVSMDLITVDLRSHPSASVGDQVILWGKGLPADEIASSAKTISYELFCRLTGRVKFRYEKSA